MAVIRVVHVTVVLLLATLGMCLPSVEENRINTLQGAGEVVTPPRSRHDDNPLRRFLASSPGRLLGQVRDQDLDNLRQRLMHEDWNQFTPPPVTEPQCHVEVQVTQRVPGRCTRLGGGFPACQAQDFITIDYTECS